VRRIISVGGIAERCDVDGCRHPADSIFRHRATGSVVSARCKTHDTPGRRRALDNGWCPTCLLDRDWHHDEDENTYSCDRAIDYAVSLEENAVN
jgi:hypothetical protein